MKCNLPVKLISWSGLLTLRLTSTFCSFFLANHKLWNNVTQSHSEMGSWEPLILQPRWVSYFMMEWHSKGCPIEEREMLRRGSWLSPAAICICGKINAHEEKKPRKFKVHYCCHSKCCHSKNKKLFFFPFPHTLFILNWVRWIYFPFPIHMIHKNAIRKLLSETTEYCFHNKVKFPLSSPQLVISWTNSWHFLGNNMQLFCHCPSPSFFYISNPNAHQIHPCTSFQDSSRLARSANCCGPHL